MLLFMWATCSSRHQLCVPVVRKKNPASLPQVPRAPIVMPQLPQKRPASSSLNARGKRQCHPKMRGLSLPQAPSSATPAGTMCTADGASPGNIAGPAVPRPVARPLAAQMSRDEALSHGGDLAETGAMSLVLHPPSKSEKMPSYSLRSIVVHDGNSPHSGHYVCYAKTGQVKWRLHHDSIVQDLQSEPQGRLGRQAYILYYVMDS